MGIRGQLTLLVPGLVAVGVTIVAVFAVREERRSELEDFRVRNEKVLGAIGVTAAVHVAQNDLGALDTLVAQLMEADQAKGGDLRELAVLDDKGRVLADSDVARFNETLEDDFSREAVESDRTVWRRERGALRIAVPAVSGIRWATVSATFSLDHLEATLARSRVKWTVGALVLFLLIGGLTFLGLDVLAVRPVRALQQAVRRMGEGHLSTRAPPLRGSELAELSDNVNRMAQALQAERENLERTVAERTRELQEANARLERLAVTDGLTGLYNHRRFYEALHTELLRSDRHRRPLAVLMIDVDFFKRVNDALGHPIGDDLLRRLAEVLSKDLRQTDLIARYGGEEFAVILPETSKAEALQVAERMRAAVESKVNEGGPWRQTVTVSIGVAVFPEDGRSAEPLLAAADAAMYVAKRQGRNRVVGSRAA